MSGSVVSVPGVLGGKPVIKGTRLSVEFILELLSSGMSVVDVVKEYPQLKPADVYAAISYAAKSLKHEDIIFSAGSKGFKLPS